MFYEQFELLCKRHNIKETTLARELGMGASAPGRWKKGATPDLVNAKKIADYFGVTIDSLVGDELSPSISNIVGSISNSAVMHGNANGPVSISNSGAPARNELTDQESEVLRIFRALDMRQKNTAMTYLYNLEDEAKETHLQLNNDK